LARGKFYVKLNILGSKDFVEGDPFNDLEEALMYAVEGGYRMYEVDVRVALAWAYLSAGKTNSAKQFAQLALSMGNEMGYHWGKVDASEVLSKLDSKNL
jgi:hypothetical protein